MCRFFHPTLDRFDRAMIFSVLLHYGIADKIVSAIRVLYGHSTCQFYLQGQLSEFIIL